MMENCDVWGYVNFGEGQVKIRCTKTGEHDKHVCLVEINETGLPRGEKIEHRFNVFNRTEQTGPG